MRKLCTLFFHWLIVARAWSIVEGLERASSRVAALQSEPAKPSMNDGLVSGKPKTEPSLAEEALPSTRLERKGNRRHMPHPSVLPLTMAVT